MIRADDADLEVLSQVIASAFMDLPPSRWLIIDLDVRRQIGAVTRYVQQDARWLP